MNVHEYQAKAILRDYGVPVPRGHAAFAPEEAVAVAKELGGPITVVKDKFMLADAERVASKSARPVTKAACGSRNPWTMSGSSPTRC